MASSYQSSPMASNYNNSHRKSLGNGPKVFPPSQVVVVVVPFPAQGHLNQLLHLSRLISSHNIPVHFVGTPTHNHQTIARAQGFDQNSISNIQIHDFKVPPFASPAPNPNAESKFPSHLLPSFEASSNLRDPVAALLRSLSSVSRRVVVIHDSLMASVVQDVTHIANCESYTFHSVSAFTMFFYIWDAMGRPQIPKTPLMIPKVPSLEGCFTTQFLDFITSQYEFHKFSKGAIYNTTRAIEKPYMELIETMINHKNHWALGPFNPLCIDKGLIPNKKGRHSCIDWLDKQEKNSVIYVSFGTTTAFTETQIKHLACGLENSKQKFIWVLRDADRGDFFNNNGDSNTRVEVLPKGYEERIEGMGLIVRDWAPQLEILNHPSTGGFMSHCGWNSCMESITMGVPIAAWPMHSDQPRNMVLVSEVLKIGLVVKEWEQRNEIVADTAVENAVRRLMATEEGGEMRQRAVNLKHAIRKSKVEGEGVSRVEFESFIAHVTR